MDGQRLILKITMVVLLAASDFLPYRAILCGYALVDALSAVQRSEGLVEGLLGRLRWWATIVAASSVVARLLLLVWGLAADIVVVTHATEATAALGSSNGLRGDLGTLLPIFGLDELAEILSTIFWISA